MDITTPVTSPIHIDPFTGVSTASLLLLFLLEVRPIEIKDIIKRWYAKVSSKEVDTFIKPVLKRISPKVPPIKQLGMRYLWNTFTVALSSIPSNNITAIMPKTRTGSKGKVVSI
jgi:hypothetical protein